MYKSISKKRKQIDYQSSEMLEIEKNFCFSDFRSFFLKWKKKCKSFLVLEQKSSIFGNARNFSEWVFLFFKLGKLPPEKFYFPKDRKSFFVKKYKNFCYVRARKFRFLKYKKNIFLRKYNKLS